MPIPRVIHQLWKDAEVPERYHAFCATWRRRNPGWEYRLWTDADLAALVESRFPAWRTIYDGYAFGISRADLGRYLVLKAFGGVYADLDCECLRPIDPLIAGADFAIGLEPTAHNRYYGTEHVICISFIASAPAHPFWEVVLDEVRRSVGRPGGVLEQTGPLMMNRAYAALTDKAAVRLIPASLVYPFTDHDARAGQAHDLEFWEQATRAAFVAHYWDNSWDQPSNLGYGLPVSIPARVNAVAVRAPVDDAPLISCLMSSDGRLDPAVPAIEDYLRQTYPRRELLVGVREPETALVDHVQALGRPDVRLVALTGPSQPGPIAPELLLAAAGEAVCGWEERVRYDPRRLEVQQKIRVGANSEASLLKRRIVWRPRAERIAVGADLIAASLLADALAMRAIAQQARDERAWLEALATMRTAVFDLPRLMLEIHDGEDVAAEDAFEAAWRSASVHFPAERTAAVVEKLSARLALSREPTLAAS